MAEVIRVSSLNRYVKARFEEDELLQDLALRGKLPICASSKRASVLHASG